MKELAVRLASVEDFDELWSLVSESIAGQETRLTRSSLRDDLFSRRELGSGTFPEGIEDPAIELDLSRAQPTYPCCQVLLAHLGMELVGYLMFHLFYSPWKGHKTFINYIFVKPAQRGTGVAAGLMRRLIEFARSENLDYLVYEVPRADDQLKSTLARHGSEVYRNDSTDWSVFRVQI